MPNTNEKKQINVLMVDDDADFLKSAKECLNLLGDFNVRVALSSAEAYKKIAENRPDVIVCDVQMPLTTGFEFLKELRDSGDAIPFIVFTLTEDRSFALKAFNLGANGFIGKWGAATVVYPKLKQCIEELVKNALTINASSTT